MTAAEQAAALDKAISRIIVADLHPLKGDEIDQLARKLATIRNSIAAPASTVPIYDLYAPGVWTLRDERTGQDDEGRDGPWRS
jgi:hypothetical protein